MPQDADRKRQGAKPTPSKAARKAASARLRAERAGDRKAARERARADRERLAERREALAEAIPYLATVRAPSLPLAGKHLSDEISVATYNVHRWAGLNGTRAPDAARAGYVISELDADIVALQEVLRPWDQPDPLERIAEALHLHLAFVTTACASPRRSRQCDPVALADHERLQPRSLVRSCRENARRSQPSSRAHGGRSRSLRRISPSSTARAIGRCDPSSSIRSSRAPSCCSGT